MVEFISTMPFLILFLVAWFITLILGIREEDLFKKILYLGFSLAFVIMVVSFSTVEVQAVGMNDTFDTQLGYSQIFPMENIAKVFSGLFFLQGFLFVFFLADQLMKSGYLEKK